MKTSQVAIHAAALWHTCGRDAAIRYAAKRGCPLRLVVLARQLEVSQ